MFKVGMIWQTTITSSAKNQYVIPQRREQLRELIVHLIIKTKNGKELKVKTLIDSGCTNTTIARKTVEKKGISTKLLPKPFDMYNSNESRNEKRQSRNLYL